MEYTIKLEKKEGESPQVMRSFFSPSQEEKMPHMVRSRQKGVRRAPFVSGLPIIKPERTLRDALNDLGALVQRKTDWQARNSHRQHLIRDLGEKPEPIEVHTFRDEQGLLFETETIEAA